MSTSADDFYIYCKGGCTFKQLIENFNNSNPEVIVIFYVGLRNYGGRTPGVNPANFNTYDINDAELRKKVVALILTDVTAGYQYAQNNPEDIGSLYQHFVQEHQSLGFKKLDKAEFEKIAVSLYTSKNYQREATIYNNIREHILGYDHELRDKQKQEYKERHSPQRQNLEGEVPNGAEFNSIRKAFSTMVYTSQYVSDNIYITTINDRDYDLSFGRLIYSMQAAVTECRKYASYNNKPGLYGRCLNKIAQNINEFSSAFRNKKISNAALARGIYESTDDDVIHFSRAAKLARLYSDSRLYEEVDGSIEPRNSRKLDDRGTYDPDESPSFPD